VRPFSLISLKTLGRTPNPWKYLPIYFIGIRIFRETVHFQNAYNFPLMSRRRQFFFETWILRSLWNVKASYT